MSLGLAIPVRDDPILLDRLLKQASDMGIFDQIVVVDDGSNPPVQVSERLAPDVVLYRHETARGVGIARNRTLDLVTTDHVIFMDSDDLFTYEFPNLWQDIRRRHFDFCLFRYHDSREDKTGNWGQAPYDNELWRLAGMGGCSLKKIADLDSVCALARTSNYPWNKIYRRHFLSVHKIRCSEIPVHEDVALHWLSFLNADSIYASDRVAVKHFVNTTGKRLTNRRSRERIKALPSLLKVLTHLRNARGVDDALTYNYLLFINGLLDWIRENTDPALHEELAQETAGFVRLALDEEMQHALSKQDSALLAHLKNRMRSPES